MAAPQTVSGLHPHVAGLIAGYNPLPDVWDEMVDHRGQPRPTWVKLLNRMAELGPTELARGFAAADRHLKDNGVFFRAYDQTGDGERQWPLNHMPLLISPQDWQMLKAGVMQRARLLDAVLADAYGEGLLVKRGILPSAVLAASPEFLRPLVGVRPLGDHHLRICAIDIGRGPDGRWWVLSDRTQAPSGMGYALENRIAMSRAFPDVYRLMNVERLAGFFQAFRAELNSLNKNADTRVSLLTPGPLNETYFEHAYLARYLGFLLVEGEDLTVRDDAVHVRTVSGLKRVDVLWRRMDGDFADPLELVSQSRLGVPGLVRAIRERNVLVANALGSGVVESRALMGFTQVLARELLGVDSILPNIATWWCGQPLEREIVAEDLERLVVAPAFGGRIPGNPSLTEKLGQDLSPKERERLLEHLSRRGADIVGQEVVKLSTMPTWCDGKLVPRPFVLRLFVIATGDGWRVMPGGFCRISDVDDARAVSLQHGARTSDVWILTDGPVDDMTLIPAPENIAVRRATGALPSRAADNLFWLARYIERAEATLRIVRALVTRIIDFNGASHVTIDRLVELLQDSGAIPPEKPASPFAAAVHALTNRRSLGAVPVLARAARFAAGAIRDRLAPDTWAVVTELAAKFEQLKPEGMDEADALETAREGLHIVSSFAGLSAENMNRLIGWHFLDMGRRIERAINTSLYLKFLGTPQSPTSALDLVLELCDSQITYRSRYVATAAIPMLDLLLLDDNNPRSVAFQVASLCNHLVSLPETAVDGRPSRPLRICRRIETRLSTEMAEDMNLEQLTRMVDDLQEISNAVSGRFFSHRGTPRRIQEDVG